MILRLREWLEEREAIKYVRSICGEQAIERPIEEFRNLVRKIDPEAAKIDERVHGYYTKDQIKRMWPWILRRDQAKKIVEMHIETMAEIVSKWMMRDENTERAFLPVLLAMAERGERHFHGKIARKALRKWWVAKNTTKQ